MLLVNHRASTGYGDAFATAILADWGNLDYADLMAGVDHAIEEGLADPDRLGVCGISGGGNLTGWIIGQTDRFKAACPENPVFNWFSMYGTSDVGADFSVRELGGTPYDAEDVYRRCSPITYADRCTTPTLFLQHENDYRCPAEQTEQFFAVLRVNGRAGGDAPLPGHAARRLRHRADRPPARPERGAARLDEPLRARRHRRGGSGRGGGGSGLGARLGEPLGELGILGAEPVDVRALDGEDLAVASARERAPCASRPPRGAPARRPPSRGRARVSPSGASTTTCPSTTT